MPAQDTVKIMIGKSKSFDVELINKAVLHVKMPTAERLLMFTDYATQISDSSNGEYIEDSVLGPIMKEVTVFILQDNHERVEITDEFLRNNLLDELEMQVALMEAFSHWINDLVNDPN